MKTTISEPSGLTRWFESLAVFFSWGYSVLQLSLSCFICSELTADLLRSSNVSRFQQLVRLDLSCTYLYIVPPSRRSSSELSSVVNRGCVDVASNQAMANMQKSDHYTQYKNLNVEVSTAFVFFICIFQNVSPFWSSYFQLQPCLHLISNNFQRLQTVGCDPWVWPLVRVSGRWRGESQPSLATPSSTAVEIVGNLAVGSSFTSKQQHNEPTAHWSRRRFLTWTTFSALLSACSSGSFFALKPFPTFPFPLHPWTSDFFVYLPCSPPRSTPSLPLLTPTVISPASLNLRPLWVGCTSGSHFAGGAILPFTPVSWQVLRDINHLFQSGDESQALEKTHSLPRRSRGVTELKGIYCASAIKCLENSRIATFLHIDVILQRRASTLAFSGVTHQLSIPWGLKSE